MININSYPDDVKNDVGHTNEIEPTHKFPDDDSNVGDNPLYPNNENTIPICDKPTIDNSLNENDNIPSNNENDRIPGQSRENKIDQDVGSGHGGVYPYNINSNTSDNDEANDLETETPPSDDNKDQDFENSDQDYENTHN